MKPRGVPFFKKADAILIAACVLAAGLLFFLGLPRQGAGEGLVAVIYLEGAEYARIPLDEVDEPYALPLEGALKFTLAVEPGGIRYERSDCPDKVCVHTGRLSKAGDFAACLPARSAVLIVSEETPASPVDFIAH